MRAVLPVRFLCVLAGASLVALTQALWKFPHARPTPAELARNVVDGPWGRLELTPFLLEKPPEMLPDTAAELEPTRWHLAGHTRDSAAAFLRSCGFTTAELGALTNSSVLTEAGNGCWLTPSAETVLSFGAPTRERLYAELEKSEQNIAKRHPFRVRLTESSMWFTRVGLPEDKVQLARKLTYRRDDSLCFSDAEVAKAYFTPAEFTALVRALYSSDTLLVRLRVRTNDPIDRIAAYWGRGGREETLKALLESAARSPGGAQIDIDNLLPPLPRSWLYTYPAKPKDAPSAGDCYWTSLNFFRSVADDRFLDPALRTAEIRENYRLVPRAENLGDVIIFADAQGMTQHACVFVAGDIVFTKNGAQNSHPWVLMRMDQMRARYLQSGGKTLVFRPQRT